MSVQTRNDEAQSLIRADTPYPGLLLIGQIKVGAAGLASFDFQNIPATFTHLKLILSVRTDRAAQAVDNVILRFNNDNSANYHYEQLQANNITAGATPFNAQTSALAAICPGATGLASSFGITEICVPNYAAPILPGYISTGGRLTVAAAANLWVDVWAGWLNVAGAVSRITLQSSNAANFVQYSCASLYGLY